MSPLIACRGAAVAMLVERYVHGVRVAEQVVEVAQDFLIGADENKPR